MTKRLVALFLTLMFALSLSAAFAAETGLESVEYKGFGIFEIEFTSDCDWYASSTIALKDDSGEALPFAIIGGEGDDCYLRAENIEAGAAYTLEFSMNGAEWNVALRADTGIEFKLDKNGNVREEKENDACDWCGSVGHDDDFCPTRIDETELPEDADALARLFDLDRCDRCGGIGHDDDICPGK